MRVNGAALINRPCRCQDRRNGLPQAGKEVERVYADGLLGRCSEKDGKDKSTCKTFVAS